MEDKESRQKTVVAFIAGLLIGGILVYIFAAMPDRGEKTANTEKATGTELGKESLGPSNTTAEVDSAMKAEDAKSVASVEADRDGSLTVDDQPAGSVVTIANLSTPSNAGWVVVHEINADGSLGRALGASRYNEADGLMPVRIELLRATSANATYRVVIYSENGDKVFDLKEDKPMTQDGKMIEDSFKTLAAQAS